MPESTNAALTTVPVEEEEEESCERCSERQDDCLCRECESCGTGFYHPDAETCCDNYCSYRCAERNDHYHCPCGKIAGSDNHSCSDCGRGECCREFICTTDDCNLCTHCCTCSEDVQSEYIQRASCRRYPASNPVHAPYAPFLFSGVELELECENDDECNDVATRLQVYARQILLKEDSSLKCGFEIVSGKNSLEAQQQLWPLVADLARKAGARSWKHATTGLHVHLSRDWFTPLTLGKFLVFLNSPSTRAPIIKLAGRDCPNYAAINAKKLTDGRKTENGRYEAVNLTNSATIEIRIFKGTLNTEHILADIEFCYAAAHWSAQVSATDCEAWDKFWVYVQAHKKEYRHLIRFFLPTVAPKRRRSIMCQAIVKPANLTIDKAILQLAWDQNGDGAGFAAKLPDNTVIIEKGFFTFEHFWHAYMPYEYLDCLIHFRFATHGEKVRANCHPFALGPEAAMVHNGVLSQFLPGVLDTRSDTRLFIDEILLPAWSASGMSVSAFFAQPGMATLFERFVEGNKLALLTPEGFIIINEHLGEWQDQIWYSAGVPTPAYAYTAWPTSWAQTRGYDEDEAWEQAWERWNEEEEEERGCCLCEAPGPLYQIGSEGLCAGCWNEYTRPGVPGTRC